MKTNQYWKCLVLTPLLAAGLLAACGGGGIGSGGTGSAPSGVAYGTVNGFGSIFVGGVRCDDTRAKVAWSGVLGGPEAANPDVKLGQHVEISFDGASATCKVLQALVDPELIGVVSSLAPLTVAGQPVLINSDASVAPPTVLDGFADAAAIHVGDRVEVHGKPVSANGAVAIQATRIERKPAADTWVRAKGVVKNLANGQFTLGGLTVKTNANSVLDPTGLVLANDQTVVVWSTGAIAQDGSVTARFVRLARRDLANQQAVRVEGPVSGCTASPCPLPTVDGLTIDLANASFVNGTAADVANGVALRVEGSYDSGTSRLVASKASVRLRDTTAGDVTLIGLVGDYVSNTDFTVRGVPVTTDANTVVGAGCSIGAGQIVGVKGHIAQSQVTATKVDCLSLVDGLTLDIFGALLNVDAAAKSFSLSEGPYRSLTLNWDDNTVFGAGLTAATLANGQRVGLRAVLTDGKLLVKRIIGDDVPTAPAGVQLFGNFGIAHDVTAGSLVVNKIQMAILPGTTTLNGNVANGSPVRTWFYRTGALQPWIALQVKEIVWN
jgi:Domain of unknown function (DUF5666)